MILHPLRTWDGRYVPANATDIRKLFAHVRAQIHRDVPKAGNGGRKEEAREGGQGNADVLVHSDDREWA